MYNVFRLIVILLIFASTTHAAPFFTEDFDDWDDGSINDVNDTWSADPPCPAPYATCRADDTSTAGTPDYASSSSFGRSGKGVRVYYWSDSGFTAGDNGFRGASLFTAPKDFYIRYSYRYSGTSSTNYNKLFRFYDSGGQVMILELNTSSAWGNKTVLYLFVNGQTIEYPYLDWTLDDDYTPDTWISIEVFIDQTNDESTLYIDGVQQGNAVAFGVSSDYTMTAIQIGGNYVGGSNLTGDYDDIVLSDTYIGPIDSTTPTITPGITIKGATIQ